MATEDTILFDDIGDGILLTLVEPAGHRREEHSEGARIDHGGRVYTTDLRLDETITARNNDVVMVPEGYHPVASAAGYNTYYLNFLAGSAQSLANSDDPEHAWVKDTWRETDPRVPLVTKAMEQLQ